MDAKTRNFTDVRAAMQRYVDQEILAGVSWTVLRGRDVADQQCVGFADREAKTALRSDHIFRAFSNTKLLVTCAIMMLVEQGRIGLDDAVEKFLPQLANRTVLKADAKSSPMSSRRRVRSRSVGCSPTPPAFLTDFSIRAR
jgi:CubicO group peptidase (beta-lactamase class C family)